uniref:HAT C-terminal dimerisation domain-containing protein n=1 Tax=Anopheles maculatus TaxID=74869 RepID=A0A182T4D6_9DIPT
MFDMMDRFHKNKYPILACLERVEHNVQFNDWSIVEQSMKVLLNFDHATKVLTTDKFVALSQTGLLSNILLTKMQALVDERMEFPVKRLATSLIEELSSKCKPYLQSTLVCRAMILDPRMKNHSFENDRQRYEETYQSLIETITPLKVSATPATEPVAPKPFADPSLQSLFSDFATSIKRVKNSAHPEVAAKLELDEYLKMDCIELTEDPLLWWKTYKSQFPALCQVVQNLFCIPATCVPPERIFSKDGDMYAIKRAALAPEKLSEMLFLQQNKKYISPQLMIVDGWKNP